ncbi:methylenetetrahydrofolate--tRNA-(uracil(54)-C(5))-methyltransferase (FADH(2)-oxidizing) TrmFO [Spiroplasma alleghenense]|uniref:Methylenetetrahydrofolate--tRNA-(uracil-5-)-methyltransferase TrmFO n=1 Tax=Spiroplasma alleghenense TaxID=216931 RepID=A0A345Z386_9MOLU|nr:methylenetetrahydrofolate--tRNA-(uracil(54)-C(5))-methyltransferase (FADH(2)-oxidizing) TrmFO [Spiroplasma alleghenense]AXK51065.1 tRNA (uracil-5-)-methyltransferase Gid [Spiroplasma alleghenense]
MKSYVNVIGAGLAGCEAAYQLSKKGIKVNLYEVKRLQRNPVQNLNSFAELVCSNSLRSDDLKNAVGTLKEEMRQFDSLIIKAAEKNKLPAGGSLAVDRENFSNYITNLIENDPNITIINQEVEKIDTLIPTIIATGPLTTSSLQKEIQNLIGKDYFYFYDAVAPIIKKDSINMEIAFKKNRYEKGDTQDYINCPMNEEQFKKFYQELIKAEVMEGHLEKDKALKYFEGCMPIEGMAKRGYKTMLFGPLKPAGLRNLDGSPNFAVVQLRQDNAIDDLYNMVGFQTNLKWPEQKRVFQLIPGLEKAEFVRYGVMHLNNFINSPKILNHFLQMKAQENIFFAGQITGVEGYVESAATGIIAAKNLINLLENKPMIQIPTTTVIGGLINYINTTSSENFQPMKANWSIVASLPLSQAKARKEDKKQAYSNRAIEEIKKVVLSFN